jgi:hypothetical protein
VDDIFDAPDEIFTGAFFTAGFTLPGGTGLGPVAKSWGCQVFYFGFFNPAVSGRSNSWGDNCGYSYGSPQIEAGYLFGMSRHIKSNKVTSTCKKGCNAKD